MRHVCGAPGTPLAVVTNMLISTARQAAICMLVGLERRLCAGVSPVQGV